MPKPGKKPGPRNAAKAEKRFNEVLQFPTMPAIPMPTAAPASQAVSPPSIPTLPTSAEDIPMPVVTNRHRDTTVPRQRPQNLPDALKMIDALEGENNKLRDRADQAEMHCAVVKICYEGEKKVNAKSTRKETTTVTFSAEARCIASGPGLIQFKAQVAVDNEKKRKRQETQEKRAANKAARVAERNRTGPTEFFTGSLTSKNKDDLVEIAQLFSLLITHPVQPGSKPKELTKVELTTAIKAHFVTHPELKNTPRFTGLFGARPRRDPAPDKENAPPAAAATAMALRFQTVAQPLAGPSHHLTAQAQNSPYPHHLHIPPPATANFNHYPVPYQAHYHTFPTNQVQVPPYNSTYGHPNQLYHPYQPRAP